MNQKYHAHIYFKEEQQSAARVLNSLVSELQGSKAHLGTFHLKPVGPHPIPMFTAMFDVSTKKEFMSFLELNRGTLSVLIHEDTGDDYRDHTDGAEWLGEKIALNFEHFEIIKNDKSALVFPEI